MATGAGAGAGAGGAGLTGTPLAEMLKILNAFKKAMGESQNGLTRAVRDLDGLASTTGSASTRIGRFSDELDHVNKSLKDHVKEARELAKAIRDNTSITTTSSEEYKKQSEELSDSIESNIRTIKTKTNAEIKELERNKKHIHRKIEQERKQIETSALTSAILASRTKNSASQFTATAAALDSLQRALAAKLDEAAAIKGDDPTQASKLGMLMTEIAFLSEEVGKASDSFDEIAKKSKMLSTELEDRFNTKSLSHARIAELNSLLSADKLSAEHGALAVANLEQFNRMKADEREEELKQNREANRAAIRKEAISQLDDNQLRASIDRMKQRADTFAEGVKQAEAKLKKIIEDRNEAAKTGDASGLERLNKEYAAASQETQRLRDGFRSTTKRHAAYEEALRTGAHRQSLKGAITTKVTQEFGRLASLSALLAVSLKMWKESIAQSTTGTANSVTEFLANYWTAATKFGVSAASFQEVMANSRLAQLTATTAGFDTALRNSSLKMFSFVGDRNEAMKITGGLYTAFANVGISSEVAKGNIDKLIPIIGQLSRVTGKTTAEMARLVESYYTENEHRITMVGMSEDQRASAAKLLALQNLDIQSKGYSLAQAQEIQRENAKNRMKSTMSERVRDQAVLQQQARLIASVMSRTGDHAGAKTMMDGADRIRQIGAQLAHGKIDPNLQTELINERVMIAGKMAKANAELLVNMGSEDSNRPAVEHVRDTLGSMKSISNGGIDTINTQDPKKPKVDEARVVGSTGMFGGAVGRLVSVSQKIYEAVSSTPVQLGLILLALIASRGMLGNIGKLMLGKIKSPSVPRLGGPGAGAGAGAGPWLKRIPLLGALIGGAFALDDYNDVGDQEKAGEVSAEEATHERKKIGAKFAGSTAGAWAMGEVGAAAGLAAGAVVGPGVAVTVPLGAAIGATLGYFGGEALGEAVVGDYKPPADTETAKITQRQATIDNLTKEKSELHATIEATKGLGGASGTIAQLSTTRMEAVQKQLDGFTDDRSNSTVPTPANPQSKLTNLNNNPITNALNSGNDANAITTNTVPSKTGGTAAQSEETKNRETNELEQKPTNVSSLLETINQSIGQLIAVVNKNNSKDSDLIDSQQDFLTVATSTERLNTAFNSVGVKFS